MRPTTLFMPLLNEGTEVWRSVEAEPLGDGTFRILGPTPNSEEWAFGPGSIVSCEPQVLSDGEEHLVAVGTIP
jgi:hypothetical protein